MKFNLIVKIAAYFTILLFALFCASCGDGQKPAEPRASSTSPESFTFFDVGKNSSISKSLRKELNSKFGDDAIQRRSTIDLDINYTGFLKDHFPELDQLNHQLNPQLRKWIEHRTIKLMYRYAKVRNVPFDYVEIVFSEYTQTPVLFKIYFKKDELDTIETLKLKYGPPEIIQWGEEIAQAMSWRKNDDYLFLSIVPDQFGNPTYRVVIYFTKALEEMIKDELTGKEELKKDRTDSDKTAF